jgi:hypothetical protein
VTFQLHNPTTDTLFIRQECFVDFTITSCADDYDEELELWAWCSVDCADPAGGCISCEMCLDEGIPIVPGGSFDVSWPGLTYTFGTNADGCTCHDDHAEPAGLHQIRVPVFRTAEDAELDVAAYEVSLDFPLPAPLGVVQVPLASF